MSATSLPPLLTVFHSLQPVAQQLLARLNQVGHAGPPQAFYYPAKDYPSVFGRSGPLPPMAHAVDFHPYRRNVTRQQFIASHQRGFLQPLDF